MLKAYTGDSKRELKTLKANSVGIDAYHGGSVEGNHCMHFGEYGNTVMDTIKRHAAKNKRCQ